MSKKRCDDPTFTISATETEWLAVTTLASFAAAIYLHEKSGKPLPSIGREHVEFAIEDGLEPTNRIICELAKRNVSECPPKI